MMQKSVLDQLKENTVAITGLLVAILALGYTTWRGELTEKNFTIRLAAFEILKNLGELQRVVNYSHFAEKKDPLGNPLLGWGHISIIGDLSQLMPSPTPETIKELIEAWNQDWKGIQTNQANVDEISQKIDKSRETVLDTLHSLK